MSKHPVSMTAFCGDLPVDSMAGRHALAKVIVDACTVIGDYVVIDAQTLAAAGVGPDTLEYCDWLLEHGLRQYRKRKGLYQIGRRFL